MSNFEQCRLFDGEDVAIEHSQAPELGPKTSSQIDYAERRLSDAAIDQGWGWQRHTALEDTETANNSVESWTPPTSEELARVKTMISTARELLREKQHRQL